MSATQATVEALGVAVAARVPVLLWGAPGTGKTSAIRAMAAELGLPCKTVIASIREPSDFAGLPVPPCRRSRRPWPPTRPSSAGSPPGRCWAAHRSAVRTWRHSPPGCSRSAARTVWRRPPS